MSKNSGCLFFFLKIFSSPEKPKEEESTELAYRLKESLLTECELHFYNHLSQVVQDKLLIQAKIRLADVFDVTASDRSTRSKCFNKIKSKHFDFVLCHPKTYKILCAIELDDSSHKRKDRIARDEFLNKACEVSNFPLIRVKASQSYDTKELLTNIQNAISDKT